MRIIIKCNRYTSIDSMLRLLGWIKVEKFCEMKALIFIHKIKGGTMPEYFNGIIQDFQQTHEYNTRNKKNFALKQKNYKKSQNSIFFRALLEYNRLPEIVKNVTNVNRFKLELRNIFLVNSS